MLADMPNGDEKRESNQKTLFGKPNRNPKKTGLKMKNPLENPDPIPRVHYHYFAYDLSMNPKWMNENYVDFDKYQVGKLIGFELVFNIPGINGIAMPNLRQKKQNIVYGILYSLSSPRDGILKLEDSLGRHKGRLFTEDVRVEVDDGRHIPATIFVASSDECCDTLSRMEESYFHKLLAAAEMLPNDYKEELRKNLKRFLLIHYQAQSGKTFEEKRLATSEKMLPRYVKNGFWKFF